MEKVSEQWSTNGITTVVKLQLGAPVSLECGLGWKFQIRQPKASRSGGGQWQLLFHPFRLMQADLGTLTLSASQESNHQNAVQHSYSLPLNHSHSDVIASFSTADIQMDPFLHLTVTLPSLHFPVSPQAIIPPKIMRILNQSLGEDFTDTKFYLFSCRTPSGRMSRPRPLYANSALLEGHSSYLDTLLFTKDFAESVLRDDPSAVMPETDSHVYDYESDSDIDEDLDPGDKLDGLNDPSLGAWGHGHQQTRRVIPILGTAHATWRAFLFYLYTKELVFSALKSSPMRVPNDSQPVDDPEEPRQLIASRTPSCSPKSMYRLADLIGMEDLRKLAFQAIDANLFEENIIEELFSEFTSRYPEVREMEMDALCRYYDSPFVSEWLLKMLEKTTSGSFARGHDIFASLLKKLKPRERNPEEHSEIPNLEDGMDCK